MSYTGPRQLFINNQFVDSQSKKTFPTINPANGQVICQVAEGDKADIDVAVEAAAKAFLFWKALPGEARAGYLFEIAGLVEKNREELAQIECLDNGMNITAARQTVGGVAMWFRHFAGYADKMGGKTVPLVNPSLFSYTLREPIGVVGAIVPWNFPLMLTAWKLAPALCCGNTVVVKPSEKTPLSILKLCEIFVQAKLPPGVVNVVPGYGHTAGDALARHMKVRKISFTGSGNTGKAVLRAAADSNLKRVTLELGGKSPVIICEDCNVDVAATLAYQAIFPHQGQVCAAGSRVFVHEKIHDAFVKKLVELAKARLEKVGDPREEKTELGPVVDDLQFKRVSAYIESGIKDGATLAFGGRTISRPGYYIEPTVFTNVNDKMKIAEEEIFGPVQAIFKYKDLKDAVKRANNTEYGLAAGVFTTDLTKAHLLAAEIEAGSVWINTYSPILPQTAFGGYKQSGLGREGSEAVLNEYTNLKSVTMQLGKL